MTAALVVAAIQTENVLGSPAANLARVEPLVRSAAEQGARLIVLPELLASGYAPESRPALAAEDLNRSPTVSTLRGWSRRLPGQPVLITTVLERRAGGAPCNTAVVVGADGLLGTQRKIHLWGDEHGAFAAGTTVGPIRTEVGTVGVATCYDAGFPEVARSIAVQGATLLAVPAAFGAGRAYAWDLLTRARALENGCLLIAAGYCGSTAGRTFAGHSRIVDPAGAVLADAGDRPGVVVAPLPAGAVERQRELLPYLHDLRPLR